MRKNIVMGKLMQFLSTAAWPVVAGLGLSDQKRAQPITPQGLFRLGYLLFGDWSTQNAPAASGMLPTTYFHVLPCTSRGRGWPFKKHCGAGWLINKMLFKNIRSAIVFCHDAAGLNTANRRTMGKKAAPKKLTVENVAVYNKGEFRKDLFQPHRYDITFRQRRKFPPRVAKARSGGAVTSPNLEAKEGGCSPVRQLPGNTRRPLQPW